MTRFTVGLLVALFISVNSYAFDENPVEWVPPDIQTYYQTGNTTGITPSETATNYWASNYASVASSSNPTYQDIENLGVTDYGMSSSKYKFYGQYSYCFPPDSNGNQSCGTGGTFIYVIKVPDAKVCPPAVAPDYIRGPMTASDGTENVCLPQFDKCALGYFENAVTPSNGQKQCVPITCPSSGTLSQVFNNNSLVTVGASGTYCDGKCAYSVSSDGAPYANASFISATSTGSICGQGSPSDAFFQSGYGDESGCETNTLSSGGSFLTCNDAATQGEPAESSSGDLQETADDAFVDTTNSTDPFSPLDCTVSGSEISCVGTNITDAIEHQTNEQKKLDDEKHNKLVQMQQDVAEYLDQQQRERDANSLVQSANETGQIVAAIGGIGGGSSSESNDDLIEDFDGDSLLSQFETFLGAKESELESGQSELDSAVSDGLNSFKPDSGVWSGFKNIPDYLPADATCSPFTLGLEPHTIDLDLCEYNEIIKAAISFIFIILTAMRLFYQTQRIVRNVALAQG